MNREIALNQIDQALAQCSHIKDGRGLDQQMASYLAEMLIGTISRFTTPKSSYSDRIKSLREKEINSYDGYIVPYLVGMLKSIRLEIESGYIERFAGLIRADAFSDFLAMAQHLLDERYKDPAAVIAGSVLEQHLRSLCDLNGVVTTLPDGRWKKADLINADLAKAEIYSKLNQKNITSWLGLRNEAAHGNYGSYEEANVRLMIDGISFFMLQHPA